MFCWSPSSISTLIRYQDLLDTATLSGSSGAGPASSLPWTRKPTEIPFNQDFDDPSLITPTFTGWKMLGVQKRGAINRGTSADLSWRNHHLNLASRWTLIIGKLLRRISFNMGCLLFSKCWDIAQAPAAHPERAAGRERPRAASTDCSHLCFSSCPTANPE